MLRKALVAIPLIVLVFFALHYPLPAPWIDTRARHLMTLLVERFPELANSENDPQRASFGGGVEKSPDGEFFNFTIGGIPDRKRQDAILAAISNELSHEPVQSAQIVFWMKDSAGVISRTREEWIGRNPPK